MFAHDGGMGGNGTWLSPFAFSWHLRVAVPFALCSPVCAHWEYRKTKIVFQKKYADRRRSQVHNVWWDGWEWHLALPVCALIWRLRLGSRLRSMEIQKQKNTFKERC